MTDLLQTINTTTRAGLVKALERAAAGGRTSTAETLLGTLSAQYPNNLTNEAVRALNRAVHCRKWETVVYLADFLADTARSQTVAGGGSQTFEHIDQEVLRCLADHRQKHHEAQGTDKPFCLTDAIEEKCLERGIEFATSVAIVNCSARGTPPADRLECAQKSITVESSSESGESEESEESEESGESEESEESGESGDQIITFEYVDPELPPDSYGGRDNPRLHFNLSEPDSFVAELRGKEDPVAPPGKINLRLTFPPEISGDYEVETSGTREDLARAVAGKYGDLLSKGPAGYDLADLDLERIVRAREGGADPVYTTKIIV